MTLLVLAQKLHGHLALLAVALLCHPVWTLWRRAGISRGTRVAALLATLTTFLANLAGWLVYPAFRRLVKGRLYAIAPSYVDLFEVKEHLAFFALVCAIAGAAVLLLARGEPTAALRKPAQWLFALAALLAAAAAALGLVVASVAAFRTAG